MQNMENTAETTEMHAGVFKNGRGCAKEEMSRQTARPVNTGQDAVPHSTILGVAPDGSWYALNVSNNNNDSNAESLLGKAGKQQMEATVKGNKPRNCEQCAASVEEAVADSIKYIDIDLESASTAASETCGGCKATEEQLAQNGVGRDDSSTACRHNHFMTTAKLQLSAEFTAACITAASLYGLDGAAASVTPPANSSSNRTSVNNSTDNLSYSSDNYYADELLVLQSTLSTDDIENDEEAEKISLYSDDCVYAYRGDDADYELTLAAINNRSRFVDDETDFLEMDFEPDPLSELECSGGVGAMDVANSFLLHRDACALPPNVGEAHLQRLLYSSPIDNMMVEPLHKNGGLQSQSSLLSKNFARIALHLDQIKADETPAPSVGSRRESACLATAVESIPEPAEPLAQSLPNSLLATFGRDAQDIKDIPTTNPSKITGAKPKRFNTFSTSSSTSSKNSSKSRTSVRSSFIATTGLCTSSSFDERHSSCTDFRCNPADDLATNESAAAANASSISTVVSVAFNDETCLDCLEKEFLANTIGKEMDLSECPKCRKRRGIHSAVYRSDNNSRNSSSLQIKSNSLSYDFNELPSDCLYQTVGATATTNEFIQFHRTEPRNRSFYGNLNELDGAHLTEKSLQVLESGSTIGTQRSACGKHLLKSFLTVKEIVTISTNNVDEETVVQALGKLQVAYNVELIKSHLRSDCQGADADYSTKTFKSLKHFILHVSKQNSNHLRLKRLIEMATRRQVDVLYKKDPHIKKIEMVPIKVSDILHQWELSENLESIKELDKRFQECNVLGKIASIIRQAQQRCSVRRPLPESIMIPQYYPSGYLTLTRKC